MLLIIKTKRFVKNHSHESKYAEAETTIIKRKKSSTRLLAEQIKTSRSIIHRLTKGNLSCKAYRKQVAPNFTNKHKIKRKSFDIWIRKKIKQSMRRKILFRDETFFHLTDTINEQNDRICAATREEANDLGSVHCETQFSPGAM